jgi:hypothetical protein
MSSGIRIKYQISVIDATFQSLKLENVLPFVQMKLLTNASIFEELEKLKNNCFVFDFETKMSFLETRRKCFCFFQLVFTVNSFNTEVKI